MDWILVEKRVAMLTSGRYTAPERRIHLYGSHISWARHDEGENKKGCRPVQTQDRSNPGQWYVSDNLLEIGEQKEETNFHSTTNSNNL